MARYTKLDEYKVRDNETGETFCLYAVERGQMLSMAEDVTVGLNMVLASRLRRGAPGQMNEMEFNSFHNAMTELHHQDPSNPLIRDMMKLCNLVASHRGKMKFSS
jgi:hypothetical protein